MKGLAADIRFGLKLLASRPGFTAAAVLTLALGIGANTAVFSVLNGYLLRPLPYPHGDQLVRLDESFVDQGLMHAGMSVPMYSNVRKQVSAFTDSALFGYHGFTVQADGQAEMVAGAYATPSLFNLLGVRPFLGHTFTDDATQPGRGYQVVLSYSLWQQKFGGSADVVGNTIQIDGAGYKVVGVMPDSFAFMNRSIQLWAPVTITAAERAPKNVFHTRMKMISRLRAGASLATAHEQLQSLVVNVAKQHGPDMQDFVASGEFRLTATPWRETIVGDRAERALLLQAAVLFLLLITCVNVANLLLSRILGRTHEIALRAALGASRWRLARQLLIEGLCLALPGGMIGAALGLWSLRFLGKTAIGPGEDIVSIQPDWRVAGFALMIVALTGLVVSLLPLWHLSRTELQGLLQEGYRMAGGRRAGRIRQVLVVVELGLATVLLAGSGLLLHSLVRLQNVNPGYRLNGVLLAQTVAPTSGKGGDPAAAMALYAEMQRRVEALPGVQVVGLTDVVPFSGSHSVSSFNVRGREDQPPEANVDVVNGSLFQALGIPILHGRTFDERDRADGRPAVVVDQMFARKTFPQTEAIGKQIQFGGRYGDEWFTVVGVVPTVKIYSLSQKVERGTVYVPYTQPPLAGLPNLGLVIHASIPPTSLAASVRQAVRDVDPTVALYNVQSLHGRMLETLEGRQATMNMVLVFGGIALVLAFVGVYGVLSYAVRQRTSECGVRLALGAEPRDLLWLILRDGLLLLVSGLGIGLVLAVALGYFASSQFFGVEPFDPATLAGVTVVLSAATLLACYLPARRAARLDPVDALQCE